MELESYLLAFCQKEFPVRGIYCGAAEGGSTDEPDRGKSQRDDVLAQVKGLLAEVVSSQSFEAPQCWACGKRGLLKRDCWKVGRNKARDMQNQNVSQPGRPLGGKTGPPNNQYNSTSHVQGWTTVS